MSNRSDESPRIERRNMLADDSELEWLLCLASRYQASVKPAAPIQMPPWRRALKWLGLRPKGFKRNAA